MNQTGNPADIEKRWRHGLLLGIALQIAVLLLWAIKTGSWFVAFWILPLLIIVPGIRSAHLYTYRCASLLLIAYMLLGIVEGFVQSETRAWAVIVLFLSVAVYIGILGYVRARLKY